MSYLIGPVILSLQTRQKFKYIKKNIRRNCNGIFASNFILKSTSTDILAHHSYFTIALMKMLTVLFSGHSSCDLLALLWNYNNEETVCYR